MVTLTILIEIKLKAIKSIRYCTLFCGIKNNFHLENYGSPRILLTDTPLPIPIISRACLTIFQCSKCGVLWPQVNSVFVIASWSTEKVSLIGSNASRLSKISYIYIRCGFSVIINDALVYFQCSLQHNCPRR